VKIFALKKLEPMDDLTFRKLLANVSNEKQERIKQLRKPEDAKRALLADILVRSAIASELKISNKAIEFEANKHGKPYLVGNYCLHFNISHSGDWIVCAVDSKPVGIDIEKIMPVDLEIAAQFFSEEEYKTLMAQGSEDRQNFFFDLWTLKESYIKALGEGLSISLKSFTISFPGNDKIKVKLGNELTNWSLKQYHLEPEYKMSVCAAHKNFPDNVIIKKLKEVYSELNII
jgi:4'-phosphopantetheinyl transferase